LKKLKGFIVILLMTNALVIRSYAVETLLNVALLKIKDLLRFVFTQKARKLLIFRSTA
jgi:hypothetical protein